MKTLAELTEQVKSLRGFERIERLGNRAIVYVTDHCGVDFEKSIKRSYVAKGKGDWMNLTYHFEIS